MPCESELFETLFLKVRCVDHGDLRTPSAPTEQVGYQTAISFYTKSVGAGLGGLMCATLAAEQVSPQFPDVPVGKCMGDSS